MAMAVPYKAHRRPGGVADDVRDRHLRPVYQRDPGFLQLAVFEVRRRPPRLGRHGRGGALADRHMLLAAVELHDRELAAEISRLRALG
jgi:hypothetical protein